MRQVRSHVWLRPEGDAWDFADFLEAGNQQQQQQQKIAGTALPVFTCYLLIQCAWRSGGI